MDVFQTYFSAEVRHPRGFQLRSTRRIQITEFINICLVLKIEFQSLTHFPAEQLFFPATNQTKTKFWNVLDQHEKREDLIP